MDYLTAEQAAKIMKEPLPTFYRKAQQGIYPNKKVKGKLQFPRQAIEALAKLAQAQEKTKALSFERATNNDIWQRIEYNTQIYGPEDMVSFERVLQWLARNSEICMSAYEDGHMVGGAAIMPIDEPYILAHAKDEIKIQDIPLSAIRKWEDPGLTAYITTISIMASGNASRDARIAAYLLKNVIRWAINLHLRHDIRSWYSVGVTPEGQAILEALGFQEFLSLYNGQHKAYKLDHLAQGSEMLKHYLTKIDRGDITL